MPETTVNNIPAPAIAVRSPDLMLEQFKHAPKFKGKPMKIALVHAHGAMDAPPCGGVAFFYGEKPRVDMAIEAALARRIDGTTPTNADEFRCSTCGEKLVTDSLELFINNLDNRKAEARKRQKQARKANRSK